MRATGQFKTVVNQRRGQNDYFKGKQVNSLRPSDAYICVGKLTNIGSDNGLSLGRRQAIIWTNAGIWSMEPVGTNFSEISIVIHTCSIKCTWKCRLRSGVHFFLGINVLRYKCRSKVEWHLRKVFPSYAIKGGCVGAVVTHFDCTEKLGNVLCFKQCAVLWVKRRVSRCVRMDHKHAKRRISKAVSFGRGMGSFCWYTTTKYTVCFMYFFFPNLRTYPL